MAKLIQNGETTKGPETIMKHSVSLYTSIAFWAGTELDIFTVLDQKPLSIEQAATVLDIKPRFVERLLCALVACEVLTVKGGVFANTDESSQYLVKGKPDYLGDHVLVHPLIKWWLISSGASINEALRKGKALFEFDYFEMSFEDLLTTFRGTMSIAHKAGEELVNRFDLGRFKCMADIGGASGGLAVAVKKRYPDLRISVTDIPSVTPVTKSLLQEQGANDIEVVEWELLKGPCEQSYDLVVVRALIHVLSPDQAAQALVNIGKSVSPGGVIYILGRLLDNSKVSPPEEVVWYLLNLNCEEQAGFYSENEVAEMLMNAGFRDVRRDCLPNGDTVMQARKKVDIG